MTGQRKILLAVLILLVVGCKNNESNSDISKIDQYIIIAKYLESLAEVEHFLSINEKVKSNDSIFKLIDTIETQLKRQDLTKDLKAKIITKFDNTPRTSFNIDDETYDKLKEIKANFKSSEIISIQDLEFIEKTLDAVIWDNWYDDMNYHKVETLVKLDTLILYANKNYELPIRISYSNLPSTSMQIISNTLQKEDPNKIVFKTKKNNAVQQILEYECEAINRITGEKMKFREKKYIKLIENER